MSDKSNPWAGASRRGNGSFIKVTAIVLLIVAVMWTYLYTQRMKATKPSSAATQAIDPVNANR
jgi:uncharacterized ion transporter superfamily protein YfcC